METDGQTTLAMRGRILAVAVIGCLAACVLVGGAGSDANASAAIRTPTAARVSPNLSDGPARAGTKAARRFLTISGCPLRLGKVMTVGQVTKRSRSKDAKRIIQNTLVTTSIGATCTGILDPGGKPSAAYRSGVKRETIVGDVIVKFQWIDAAAKRRHTFGVIRVGRHPKVKFESVMWSYTRPAPTQVPGPTERSAPAAQTSGTSPILPTVSWRPWGDGWNIVAVNGYGKTVVRKKVYMQIHADASGNITVDGAFSIHEAAWGYKVTSSDSTQIVLRDGMHCLELTVQISWQSMVENGSIDKQVYTLCPDATSYYQG